MINYIEIDGFKSIKNLKLILNPINIIIGENNSGKSNFLSFFDFIDSMNNKELDNYFKVDKYFRRTDRDKEITNKITGKIFFHDYKYTFEIPENRKSENTELKKYTSNFQIYNFNKTLLRHSYILDSDAVLGKHGENFATVLYFYKENHPVPFKRLEKTIKMIIVDFEKFVFNIDENRVTLNWVNKNNLDVVLPIHQLSDNSLRFIALIFLLSQINKEELIILKEPDLGLSPSAIGMLAGFIKSSGNVSQIIISTNSPTLISEFKPEDVVYINSQGVFKRLESEPLDAWLETDSLGNLWQRNIIGTYYDR